MVWIYKENERRVTKWIWDTSGGDKEKGEVLKTEG